MDYSVKTFATQKHIIIANISILNYDNKESKEWSRSF